MASAPQDERPVPGVKLESWLVTDVGMVREHNEDSACMVPQHGFFIVADGMGGHAAGEVASAMAVETVKKSLEEATGEIATFTTAPSDTGRRALVTLLQNAVLSAHQAVYQRGQDEPDKAGMGTTLDVVLIAGPEAFVAHVGDSRTYLIRDGRTSQITTDHTVAEVLVIEGKLTIEEAQVSPLRTILVNAIGVSADVGVEMAHVTLKRGDRLLLCSDGLHDYFPADDEIAAKLSTEAPGDALAEMVELAKTRGGHDNITGVAVQIMEVVEAVPGAVELDTTTPVLEGSANPFSTDEPTETATIPTGPDGSPLKATMPMRAIPEGNELETIARHVAGRADTAPSSDPVREDKPVASAAPVESTSVDEPTTELTPVKPGTVAQAHDDKATEPVATATTAPTPKVDPDDV